jgi:hypothetical protein
MVISYKSMSDAATLIFDCKFQHRKAELVCVECELWLVILGFK